MGAYFTGKSFGKTPLISVSPNKTWEGLIGGCVAAMLVSASGAKLMGWPRPLLSGSLYGLVAAVMALIGDLTVSLLKRSAGFKVGAWGEGRGWERGAGGRAGVGGRGGGQCSNGT